MEWISQNWYIIWGLACLVFFISAAVYFRRNPDATGAQTFFWMVPFSDPTGRTPTGLTPRAVVLWLVGLIICILAAIFVPGFA
jgi:hypothetical protein